jgi:hypothetical protein
MLRAVGNKRPGIHQQSALKRQSQNGNTFATTSIAASFQMSSKKSRTPKSEAGKLSRAETEDVEEMQKPTPYDRLPSVISTFPAVFEDLEIEQWYFKLSIFSSHMKLY